MLMREVIGESLRTERERQGRTLRDVCQSATVSLGYLSEIERGSKEVSSELLVSICQSLYMTVPDLLVELAVQVGKKELINV